VEITTRQGEEGLELVLSGRLDAYWSDHLSKALEEAVRGGTHHLKLDMADVPFMSSVGIRALLRFYKETQRLGGSFAILQPSEAVRRVLELAGLESLFGAGNAVAAALVEPVLSNVFERATATFEVFDLAAREPMRCRVVGSADSLEGFCYSSSSPVRFPARTFGVGLGGFGGGFEDCRGRFGEFLAVAGAATYLPTDGTNVADVMVSAGELVPEIQALYALVGEGDFAMLARFEARADDAVSLSELADESLAICGSGAAAIVIVAETTGLVGAALRRSPCAAQKGAPFAFPEVREWLSFTPERAFPRSLALVVGIAARAEVPGLAPFLRPLAASPYPTGHFHAAAFPYRALAKGSIALASTVESLFSGEALQGILHLLGDDRPGGIESEFVRGACWLAPIAGVTVEQGR
jgi:anti-anti-sigma factor